MADTDSDVMSPQRASDPVADLRRRLARGLVIPACPLALTADRRFDERHQRGLIRYYGDAGAGGLAVGVHTTQFAIHDPTVGLYQPVLALAAETMRTWTESSVVSGQSSVGGVQGSEFKVQGSAVGGQRSGTSRQSSVVSRQSTVFKVQGSRFQVPRSAVGGRRSVTSPQSSVVSRPLSAVGPSPSPAWSAAPRRPCARRRSPCRSATTAGC